MAVLAEVLEVEIWGAMLQSPALFPPDEERQRQGCHDHLARLSRLHLRSFWHMSASNQEYHSEMEHHDNGCNNYTSWKG
jgi:hypothetical protein